MNKMYLLLQDVKITALKDHEFTAEDIFKELMKN